jgi:hypothetical protein
MDGLIKIEINCSLSTNRIVSIILLKSFHQECAKAYEQLVRFLPEGRKHPQPPDLLARPPVLARQAVFLFLRRPPDLSPVHNQSHKLNPSYPFELTHPQVLLHL